MPAGYFLQKAHFVESVPPCLSGQQGVMAMPAEPPEGRKVKSGPGRRRLWVRRLKGGLSVEQPIVGDCPSLHRMGIDTEKTINVGSFTSGQKQFLDFHRNAVLLQANRR
jgi:hypothetical protein